MNWERAKDFKYTCEIREFFSISLFEFFSISRIESRDLQIDTSISRTCRYETLLFAGDDLEKKNFYAKSFSQVIKRVI
jgi:hypothetical protein